jgi:hypothetical protein
MTLRDYLATLDRRFRIVGARFFEHLPGGGPAYVEDRHPLDFQPLCYPYPLFRYRYYCDLLHLKHPLQRWDRDAPGIVAGVGAHLASSAATLLEPAEPVFCHHFPYRAESVTRRRLERLFGLDGGADRIGTDPAHGTQLRKLRALDAVYGRRWEDVPYFTPCVPGYVPMFRSFAEWVPSADAEVDRWY